MTVSFTRTREQLRSMVLRKLGVLEPNGSAVSADADIVYEAMDLRLKEMHRLGIFWRKVDRVPVTFSLSAGAATAQALSNDILFPILMTVRNVSTDEPVDIIGAVEYAEIDNKGLAGLPTKVLWKGSTEFAFHPVPTAATTVRLTYERIADDTTAGSAIDTEVSMMRWMKDIIAYDVADDFAVDETRIQRFMKEALVAERNIRKLAVERKDPTPVAVDQWDDAPDRRESDYGR